MNIFHESEYIDRIKNKSKNSRKFILLLLLFLLVMRARAKKKLLQNAKEYAIIAADGDTCIQPQSQEKRICLKYAT